MQKLSQYSVVAIYDQIYADYNKRAKGLEKTPSVGTVIWNYMLGLKYPKNPKLLEDLIHYTINKCKSSKEIG